MQTLRILSTYKIENCQFWDQNVTLINLTYRKPFWQRLIDDMSLLLKLIRNRRKFDVIFTNSDRPCNIFAIIQGLLGKKTHHVMFNCLWMTPRNRVLKFLRRIFFKLVSSGVDKFIVIGKHEIKDFNKMFCIPQDKFIFIPFYFTPNISRYRISNGDYIFSGGHFHYRDYKTLLEAVRGLNIKCKIATQLPELFTNMDVPSNVDTFYLSEEEYCKCMARSKMVIIPLKKDCLRSAGQRTYLNAMIMGKPVIICDDKGVYDYVDNGVNGIIVPPGNVVSLKKAIEWILTSNKAKEMAQKGRDKAKRFTMDNTMTKILNLLEKIAEQKL